MDGFFFAKYKNNFSATTTELVASGSMVRKEQSMFTVALTGCVVSGPCDTSTQTTRTCIAAGYADGVEGID